jgi:uncharacterized protein (TIGR03083 family)
MPYDTFAEAAHAYADLVRSIPPDAWTRPGLGEWNVRDLVGHTSRSLITVETYLGRPTAAEQVASSAEYYTVTSQIDPASVAERGRLAGRALGEEPAQVVDALVARVLPLAKRDDDPLLETAAGGTRLTNYLPTRTFELVVHGYDIATATGLAPPAYSARLLHEVIALAGAVAVATGRAPEVIRALTGRAALPANFTVV